MVGSIHLRFNNTKGNMHFPFFLYFCFSFALCVCVCLYQIQWLLFPVRIAALSRTTVNDVKHKMCANFHFVDKYVNCLLLVLFCWEREREYSPLLINKNAIQYQQQHQQLQWLQNFHHLYVRYMHTTSSSEIEIMYLMWCVYNSHKYLPNFVRSGWGPQKLAKCTCSFHIRPTWYSFG